MIANHDSDLRREAVSELVRLRDAVGGPTSILDRLYASALEEWAGRLGMDLPQLTNLVLAREAALARSSWQGSGAAPT